MKYIFLMLTYFTSSFAFGQKIEKFYDLGWKETNPADARYYSISRFTDSGWYKEDYYIREKSLQMKGLYSDSSFKIKNGEFVFFYPDKKVERIGVYKNNAKEGLWLSFHRNGMLADSVVFKNGIETGISLRWNKDGYLVDSTALDNTGAGVGIHWFPNGNLSYKGMYTMGKKKNGTWIYYHSNGNKSSVERYETDSLLSRQYFNDYGVAINDTANTKRDAVYPGGPKSWQSYLVANLSMPVGYKIEGAEKATVVVDFGVNEDGTVSEVFVSAPFHPAFDDIAVDIIKRCKNWIPATDSHNRIVKAHKRQPITFSQIQR